MNSASMFRGASKGKDLVRRSIASMVAHLPRGILTGQEFFSFYEDHGLHIKSVHFYSPVPDTRTLSDDLFARRSEMLGIELNLEEQVSRLEQGDFADHAAEYWQVIERHASRKEVPIRFGGLDGLILYDTVRRLKPRRIIEVGCGFSTVLIHEALERNGGVQRGGYFKSVDPYPAEFVRSARLSSVEIIASPVQTVPFEQFQDLGEGDMLFIDSTHVVKIGSDVVYEINEVFPRLNKGVHVHMHDIVLPYEYDREWIIEQGKLWNEQYLLQAFLQFNEHFKIVWSAGLARAEFPERVQRFVPDFDPAVQQAGSLWMKRVKA